MSRVWKPAVPLTALLAALVLAACGARGGSDTGVRNNGRGTVVSGVALLDGQGSVLDALRGKVPNLKVRRIMGECPKVTLRNDATFMTIVTAYVYVDGIRATDTCVLESIRSRDVERVEVYPNGVSGRPGIPSHAHGLILLFLRS